MPTGSDPPSPALSATVFNALHVMTYDSAAWAFKSGASLEYMFVEKGASADQCQWFYGTDTEGGINPRADIPSNTYTIIKNGTYNSGSGTVSYGGSNYKFRLERDLSAGKQVAKAVVV
jgi:hypothetical protein